MTLTLGLPWIVTLPTNRGLISVKLLQNMCKDCFAVVETCTDIPYKFSGLPKLVRTLSVVSVVVATPMVDLSGQVNDIRVGKSEPATTTS